MKFSSKRNQIILSLNSDEFHLAANSMNEILHGLPVPGIQTEYGTKSELMELHNRLRDAYDTLPKNDTKAEADVRVAVEEAEVLRNVLKRVCKEIDEWEYSLRVGVPRAQGEHFAKEFDAMITEIKQANV